MIYKKKYFAIIPARGGSTGIKNKNLKIIGGKSLVSITSNFVKKFRFFDKIILSSDSERILRSIKSNRIIKDKRPKELSKKFSKTVETIIYLSKKFSFKQNDIIFIFEPTSPLRNKNDVLKAKKIIDKKNEISVCSFGESWTHPLRAWRKKNSKMKFFLNNKKTLLPRQKHLKAYNATGHVIAIKFKKNLSKVIYNNTSYIMINKLRSLDIDDISDFRLIKYIYENERIN